MKQTLLIAYLALFVVVGSRIAPHWQNDTALWSRTVDVAPHHARAMVNLADAYAKGRLGKVTTIGYPFPRIVTVEDRRLALFWAASARQRAHEDGILPERERRTVIMAANSNMVSILLGWKTNAIYTAFWQIPPTPRDISTVIADFPHERAALITELLEEIWQLQNAPVK